MQIVHVAGLVNKKFVGADELRRDLTKILDQVPQGGIVVTQHGKPKVVMVDIETYLRIQELEDEISDYDPKLVKRVNKALAAAKKGDTVDADEAFKQLGM